MSEASWEGRNAARERREALSLESLPEYLREHREELIQGPRPFAAYMRERLRQKGVLRQNLFLAADLSENYGYKLISEEKHTSSRDVILRLCLAAGFSEEETGEALLRYGLAPLVDRFPRDLVLLTALRHRLFDLGEVNALLERCGLAPLTKD